ncbi:MAG: hypothetical protein NTY79_03195 [Chloroflexi bacterium]|nr:hypothetical protein [Chloroflexota bacterium]
MGYRKKSKSNTNIIVITLIVVIVLGAIYYFYTNGKIPFECPSSTSTGINPVSQTGTIPPLTGPIQLTNNPKARDVLQKELKSFISGDSTDTEIAIQGSRDSDYFAKNVHDKAEANGIRAGIAIISFVGKDYQYVIDVFDTIDRGEIYVDCTGPYINETTQNASYDKVAYIKVGSEYGVIDLQTVFSYSSSDALKYEFYDKYRQTHNNTYTLPVGIIEKVEKYW